MSFQRGVIGNNTRSSFLGYIGKFGNNDVIADKNSPDTDLQVIKIIPRESEKDTPCFIARNMQSDSPHFLENTSFNNQGLQSKLPIEQSKQNSDRILNNIDFHLNNMTQEIEDAVVSSSDGIKSNRHKESDQTMIYYKKRSQLLTSIFSELQDMALKINCSKEFVKKPTIDAGKVKEKLLEYIKNIHQPVFRNLYLKNQKSLAMSVSYETETRAKIESLEKIYGMLEKMQQKNIQRSSSVSKVYKSAEKTANESSAEDYETISRTTKTAISLTSEDQLFDNNLNQWNSRSENYRSDLHKITEGSRIQILFKMAWLALFAITRANTRAGFFRAYKQLNSFFKTEELQLNQTDKGKNIIERTGFKELNSPDTSDSFNQQKNKDYIFDSPNEPNCHQNKYQKSLEECPNKLQTSSIQISVEENNATEENIKTPNPSNNLINFTELVSDYKQSNKKSDYSLLTRFPDRLNYGLICEKKGISNSIECKVLDLTQNKSVSPQENPLNEFKMQNSNASIQFGSKEQDNLRTMRITQECKFPHIITQIDDFSEELSVNKEHYNQIFSDSSFRDKNNDTNEVSGRTSRISYSEDKNAQNIEKNSQDATKNEFSKANANVKESMEYCELISNFKDNQQTNSISSKRREDEKLKQGSNHLTKKSLQPDDLILEKDLNLIAKSNDNPTLSQMPCQSTVYKRNKENKPKNKGTRLRKLILLSELTKSVREMCAELNEEAELNNRSVFAQTHRSWSHN